MFFTFIPFHFEVPSHLPFADSVLEEKAQKKKDIWYFYRLYRGCKTRQEMYHLQYKNDILIHVNHTCMTT